VGDQPPGAGQDGSHIHSFGTDINLALVAQGCSEGRQRFGVGGKGDPPGNRQSYFVGAFMAAIAMLYDRKWTKHGLGMTMREPDVIAESTITCPQCGTAKVETMPTDACQFFYDCTGCGTLLRPKKGDWCVFCSYGSVPCPPVQQADEGNCCAPSVF
jgi:hypothetical protein